MEQRRYQRVRCEMEGELAQGSATVRDISEGGVSFRSYRFLPVHQRLPLRFRLPNAALIETVTEPAWIREIPRLNCYEVGARFVDLPADYKDLLKNFISFSSKTIDTPKQFG